MKMNLLVTTAVAAILASTGLAAQGMNERGGKSPGATEKSAPSQMKGAEPGKGGSQPPRAGSQRRDETTGQSPAADNPPGPQRRQEQERTGGSRDLQQQQRTGAEQKQKQKQKQKQGAGRRQGDDAGGRSETTGRGDVQGTSLTVQQRTKIRQVVVSKKIPKVDKVNFRVSVGARVPRTVRFHPIPAEIVEIHPAWRGYRVILVGSELVIVDPASYEIVALIVV